LAFSLALASGCSSDEGGTDPSTAAGTLGGFGPAPTAPVPVVAPVTPPASAPPAEAPPPAAPAGTNPETTTPVGIAAPGTPAGGMEGGGMESGGMEGGMTPPPPAEPPVQPPPPAVTPEAFVEDSGLDCQAGNLPNNIPAEANLPDPFQKLDSTRVATLADWRCRRKELRSMAERYVYGTKPPRPASVTGTVTNNQITVNVSNNGQNASFSSMITLPTTGTAPFPAVFSVGGSDQNLFLSQGVAIINFNPNTIGAERNQSGSQQNRQNKMGAFYTLYGNTSSTGLLAAWAWGVSRYIDVIEDSAANIIDPQALAVMGCSRNGKAAFAIGALDERIALSVPFESGTAGVPLFRAVAQAEVGDNGQPSQSLPNGFNEQAWFGDDFGTFLNSANTVPMDTHEIIGLFAPRGLLILDNPFIGELTPRGAHAAALAGAEIYEALGVRDNIGYHSNTGVGTHCAIRQEYQEPLRQAVQRHLLKNVNAAGAAIQVSQTFATANPQDWIDWQTPALQ
jgi:hypothetical protein